MSITLGIRIAILAPTVFFLITYLWSILIRGHLSRGILKQAGFGPGIKSTYLLWFMVQHHLVSTYGESILLFAVNGLIITYELGRAISGTVLMMGGILLSISGIIYMFSHEDPASFPKPPIVYPILFILVFTLAIAELVFIGSYEYTTPEMSDVLFGVGALIGVAITYVHYKTSFRIVYVESPSPSPPTP